MKRFANLCRLLEAAVIFFSYKNITKYKVILLEANPLFFSLVVKLNWMVKKAANQPKAFRELPILNSQKYI